MAAEEEEDTLTPVMFQLAKYGEALEFMEKTEENPAWKVETTDPEGFTVLHWSSRNGHTRMTEYILKIGGSAEAADRNGLRALVSQHLSITYHHHQRTCLLPHHALCCLLLCCCCCHCHNK